MRLILCFTLAIAYYHTLFASQYTNERPQTPGQELIAPFIPMAQSVVEKMLKSPLTSRYYFFVERRYGMFSATLQGEDLIPVKTLEEESYKKSRNPPVDSALKSIDDHKFADLLDRLAIGEYWYRHPCREFSYHFFNKARSLAFYPTEVLVSVLGKSYQLNLTPALTPNSFSDLDSEEIIQFYNRLYRRIFNVIPFDHINFSWPKDVQVHYLAFSLDAIVQILVRELFFGENKLKPKDHQVEIHSKGHSLTLTLSASFITEVAEVQKMRNFLIQLPKPQKDKKAFHRAKGLLFAAATSHFWDLNSNYRPFFSLSSDEPNDAKKTATMAQSIVDKAKTQSNHAPSLIDHMQRAVNAYKDAKIPPEKTVIVTSKKPKKAREKSLAIIQAAIPVESMASDPVETKVEDDPADSGIASFLKIRAEYEERSSAKIDKNNIVDLVSDFVFLNQLQAEILSSERTHSPDLAAGRPVTDNAKLEEVRKWDPKDFTPLSKLVKEYIDLVNNPDKILQDLAIIGSTELKFADMIRTLGLVKDLPYCVQKEINKYKEAKTAWQNQTNQRQAETKKNEIAQQKAATRAKEVAKESAKKGLEKQHRAYQGLVDDVLRSPHLYPLKINEINAYRGQGFIAEDQKIVELEELAQLVAQKGKEFRKINQEFSYSYLQTVYARFWNGIIGTDSWQNNETDKNQKILILIMQNYPEFFLEIAQRLGKNWREQIRNLLIYKVPVAFSRSKYATFTKDLNQLLLNLHEDIANSNIKGGKIKDPGLLLTTKGTAVTVVSVRSDKTFFPKSGYSVDDLIELLEEGPKTHEDFRLLKQMLRSPDSEGIQVFSNLAHRQSGVDMVVMANLVEFYVKEKMSKIYGHLTGPEVDIKVLAQDTQGEIFKPLAQFIERTKEIYGADVRLKLSTNKCSWVERNAADSEAFNLRSQDYFASFTLLRKIR